MGKEEISENFVWEKWWDEFEILWNYKVLIRWAGFVDLNLIIDWSFINESIKKGM